MSYVRKDPDAGKEWRQKEKEVAEDETDSIFRSVDMDLNKLWEMEKDKEVWSAAVLGVEKSQTRLSDWMMTSYIRDISVANI